MWLWIAVALAGKPEITSLVPSGDGALVAALGTLDGKGWVSVYDVAAGTERGGTAVDLPAAPDTAAFSKDGSQVVVFGDDTAIAVGTTTFDAAAPVALEATPRRMTLTGPWKLVGAGQYRKLIRFDVAERKASFVPITDPPGMQATGVVVDADGALWATLEDDRGMAKTLCKLDGGVCGLRLPLPTALLSLYLRPDGRIGGVRQSSAAECTLAAYEVKDDEIVPESFGPVPACPTFSPGPDGAFLTHTAEQVRVQPASGDPIEAAPAGLAGVRDAVFAGSRVAVTDGKKVLFYDAVLQRAK